MIQSVTSFLLGFSATVSMIAILGIALKMQLQKTKDYGPLKQWMSRAIGGFIVSVSAWLVIRTIIANL